jgi:hypothetical protein
MATLLTAGPDLGSQKDSRGTFKWGSPRAPFSCRRRWTRRRSRQPYRAAQRSPVAVDTSGLLHCYRSVRYVAVLYCNQRGRGRLETALVARWTKPPAQEPVLAFDDLRVEARCASTARAARHQAGVEGIGPMGAHNSAILEMRSGERPTSEGEHSAASAVFAEAYKGRTKAIHRVASLLRPTAAQSVLAVSCGHGSW